MSRTQTRTLDLPDAQIAYDVHGPLPTADARPPLVCVGQPMDASGFTALAGQLSERTVVTYDPRGLARSTRSDGATLADPLRQAQDLHELVAHLGAGPVQVFGSSGGAITALAWLGAHPDDLSLVVAHEPPCLSYLDDAEAAGRAFAEAVTAYSQDGFGPGMARFIVMTSWPGPFTEADFDQPAPDPAAFGLPTEDDGSRDNPLLNGDSAAVPTFHFGLDLLRQARERIVLAVGEQSAGQFTARTTAALGARLGLDPVVLPGGHTGFGPEQWGGRPQAFADALRPLLR